MLVFLFSISSVNRVNIVHMSEKFKFLFLPSSHHTSIFSLSLSIAVIFPTELSSKILTFIPSSKSMKSQLFVRKLGSFISEVSGSGFSTHIEHSSMNFSKV